MSRWFGALAIAATLVLPGSTLRAQNATQRRLMDGLRDLGSNRGYTTTKLAYGGVGGGGSSTFTVDLRSGQEYRIIGQCDADCTDLDLRVHSPSGATVASDTDNDDTPVVIFTAARSGTYEVEASMVRCAQAPCYFAAAVFLSGGGGEEATVASSGSSSGSSGGSSASGGGSGGACAPTATHTALVMGQPRSGSLTSDSCVRGDNSYADYYRFTVSGTQRVSISLTSSEFDAYLSLFDASGTNIDHDDDGGDGTNAVITRTLSPGTYFVAANTLRARTTGSYTLSATAAASAPARQATSASGCEPTDTRFALVLDQPRSGSLTSDSCVRSDNSYADFYKLTVTSTQRVRIDLTSSAFDAYLVLFDDQGNSIVSNDDGAGGTDSRITRTLSPGTYFVAANTLRARTTGAYTLSASRD